MKVKLSWHHFLIVILVVILLGCLVNYLEKNNIIEGLEGKDGKESPNLTTDLNPTNDTNDTNGTTPPNDKNKSTKSHRKKPINMHSIYNNEGEQFDEDAEKASIAAEKASIAASKYAKTAQEDETYEKEYDEYAHAAYQKADSNPKKIEAFTNLSGGSITSNHYPNPLAPYEKYSCGPVNTNNFFGDIQFKPECCGNPAGSSYSNSMGCACICPDQWNYLNSRGGNRTFPSEF